MATGKRRLPDQPLPLQEKDHAANQFRQYRRRLRSPTFGDLEEYRSARWFIGRHGADAFDAIEIGGMMFVNDGIVKPCTEPDDVPAFYSVCLHYANRPGRSPDCVGNFATVERARASRTSAARRAVKHSGRAMPGSRAGRARKSAVKPASVKQEASSRFSQK